MPRVKAPVTWTFVTELRREAQARGTAVVFLHRDNYVQFWFTDENPTITEPDAPLRRYPGYTVARKTQAPSKAPRRNRSYSEKEWSKEYKWLYGDK